MGVLRHLATDRLFSMPTRCLIGRSRRCDLQLDDPGASSHHAELRWQGGRWHLRDLHSTNGTVVGADMHRLNAGELRTVSVGEAIVFGDAAETWRLVDEGPSGPFAWAETEGASHIRARDRMLFLPDTDDPQLIVLPQGEGYALEDGPNRYAVVDGQIIELGDQRWRLLLPPLAAGGEPTVETSHPAIRTIGLCFQITQAQLILRLEVHWRGQAFATPPLRAHHQLLFYLCQKRLEDRDLGHTEAAEGWVDRETLLEDLRTNENRLHVHISRLRREFAMLGIEDADRIIERNADGELRVGVADIEIRSV
ncbi:MAG: FHA domain-containing protein [Myxococcales bacterium]|nr:FHA domain-containing protein [Myxococcales bacterium]